MRALRIVLLALLLTCLCGMASAEGAVSASVNVRASRDVRDSVIRAGEDVDLLVTLSGFEPEACQWYCEGAPMEGETRTAMRISNAQASDTGVYRMDAIDGEGRVRVSVEVSLRVVDASIPQTGDSALPEAVPLTAMGASGCAVLLLAVKRRQISRA